MNSATNCSPPLSPEEHLNKLAGEMADICKRLIARVQFLESENAKKMLQLRDALDGVEEMRGQLRTKDEMISELQELLGRSRGQLEHAKGARSET